MILGNLIGRLVRGMIDRKISGKEMCVYNEAVLDCMKVIAENISLGPVALAEKMDKLMYRFDDGDVA